MLIGSKILESLGDEVTQVSSTVIKERSQAGRKWQYHASPADKRIGRIKRALKETL